MMDRKPSQDFSVRYAAAKKWRDEKQPELIEALRFCIPGREQDFGAKPRTPDETETYYSAEDLTSDLAGDLVTYFTPPEQRWCDYEILTDTPAEIADEVIALVQAREDDLFKLIEGSNYYDVAPQWGMECAAHGTPALWVSAGHISQPIYVEVVPANELLITPGHLGILDRFREKYLLTHTLPAVFAGWNVDLSDPSLERRMKNKADTALVCWGFWVDWSDPARPEWHCEITVDGKRITKDDLDLGPLEGSCPLLVGRFNPQPGRPWARGPGLKALQDLRVMDKMSEITLSALDQALRNTLIYADDGFLDLETGIEPGVAYPASRGFTREKVYELNRDVNLDQSWFASDRVEERIRAAFYQDGPRQRADTPPTATQWLDEQRRVQKRLAKPSAPLWTEFILPMIQRIEYLGVQLGRLPDALSHNGQIIKVQPVTPLQKAQNQDDVMVARSNIGLATEAMAQNNAAATVIDMPATLKRIIHTSGDRLTVVKDPNAAATAQSAGAAAPVSGQTQPGT